ncbi:tail fiber assembly protein, partial [Escherichia coli]|nr:tail fiber assembly protein [Escherichia coli]
TYRVLLNRVDTSTAPDIEWPVVPMEENSAESVNTAL